ncbi:S9 family peptidase [Acidaminobacter hydrogenoformans]|uniref:Dipeptidyl aminopeptidase/acylaminoacyl peptidase n=1 Tax=Acidaminobacter hydrogenoformans DSM 2784 TaxID=1120920 RepID=A0A1G5RW72_9FIRM|nr:S9 family peptidase [Acidaminobacter hydrogenoformans]SCZ77691.1 Dipeptidyl aminopeptidase/acylaminoacyl peptidase [Acidaminobacter hydrogenoformans DSM 2784]
MAAEVLNKVSVDGFAAFRSISSLQTSPNGQALCAVVHQPDLEKNKNVSDLWIYTRECGFRRLTTSCSDRQPRWLSDTEVVFISGRSQAETPDQETQKRPMTELFKIDIRGGEAQRVMEIPFEVSSFEPLPDHQWLVEFTYHPEWHHLTESSDILEKMEEKAAVQIIDEIPFWQNGTGFTNKTRTALGIYNPEKEAMEMLTDQLSNVEDWVYDADRRRIVLIQSQFKSKQVIFNSLALCDLSDRSLKDISHRDDFLYEICGISPEGSILFYGTDTAKYGINENGDFYSFDPSEGTVNRLTEGFNGSFGNSVGTDIRMGSKGNPRPLFHEGQWIFVTTMGSEAPLVALALDGSLTRLTPETSAAACYEFAVFEDVLTVVALVDQKPQELYALKEKGPDGTLELAPLTELNKDVAESQYVSMPEIFITTAKDGTELTGWIMKPYNFEPLRRYTGILNIHGGPKAVYGPFYYHEMQYWASEGFAVIFMNPRGSDGRGNDFADIRGQYGNVDYEDLMCFVDAVVEQHTWIDNNRLGVTGGSYGGFMTNWIIGHTDRFKAAASQRSISNWISKFGTTDIGYYFVKDQIGADPWSNYEKLWDQSPLKYADKAVTPTLFIHSDEDFRCWTAEVFQMFTALKYHGVQSRLCLFHGENHELSRSGKPKNRVRRLKEITDWMRKYL